MKKMSLTLLVALFSTVSFPVSAQDNSDIQSVVDAAVKGAVGYPCALVGAKAAALACGLVYQNLGEETKPSQQAIEESCLHAGMIAASALLPSNFQNSSAVKAIEGTTAFIQECVKKDNKTSAACKEIAKTYEKISNDKATDVKKITEEASKYPTCIHCGKLITEQGQHCEAFQGTELCTATTQNVSKENKDVKETHCPKCGHEYTPDERYHGATHECEYPVAKAMEACGRAIVEAGAELAKRWESCPECGLDLTKPENRNSHGGHTCRGKCHLPANECVEIK